MKNSCSESVSLVSELIEEKKHSYDERYLAKFNWPGPLESGDVKETTPLEEKVLDDALQCFLIHNALVEQIKKASE